MFFLLMTTDPFQFPSFYLAPALFLSLLLLFSFSKTANNNVDNCARGLHNDDDDDDDNDEGVASCPFSYPPTFS